jgi:hypothetical protein
MRRLLVRLGVSCLCLMGIALPAGRAQPPAAPRVVWKARLTLDVDRRGGVQVALMLPFQPPQPELWHQALRWTLKAPLLQVSEEKTRGWWTLRARAEGVLDREDGTVEGVTQWSGLLAILNAFNIGVLSVSVSHPDAGFSDCSLEEAPAWQNVWSTTYSEDWPTSAPAPPLHLRFGYEPQQAWRLAPLAVLLLVPIAWTLGRSRRRAAAEDRFREWFRTWRFLRRLRLGLGCTWLVAVVVLGAVPLTAFLACGLSPQGEWVWVALALLLPPALAMLLCQVLLAPAFAGVPEVGWTRGRLLQQALWAQLGGVAVFTCLGWGVDAQLAEPSSYWGTMSLVVAGGLTLLCVGGWFQARNLVLEVLPPGPLRERLFELAAQVPVRVSQAYLLPPASWRLVNVVGGIGPCVHLTPEVLPHLSRREVDALLAAELARLWRSQRGVLLRLFVLFLLMLGGGILGGLLAYFTDLKSAGVLAPAVFVAVVAWRLRRRRPHFTSSLDRDTLGLTGDPEALITALAKLRRLGLLPLVAGAETDASAGPPEEWSRLHDLADRARIPPERLHEILDRPGSGDDRYPPLETSPGLRPDSDPRVFSRAFKRRATAWQSWTGLTLEVATPALVAYLVQREHVSGVWLIAAYVAGLPLTLLLRYLGVRYMVVRASRALRHGIRDRLVADGLKPDAWGGLFVSLSPHAEPRSYENFLNWDMGFLIVSGDRLCYLGDRTRFALDREHIRDAYLGPGGAGWWPIPRVYVVWHDAQRGVGGTLNLTVSSTRTLGRPRRRAAELLQRSHSWLKATDAPAELPEPLRRLPSPDFGAVASESLRKLAAGNILLTLLIYRAPFAVGACLLLGLSFDRDPRAGGWYVLASVALLQVWTVLSFLRYRGGRRDSEDADALPSEAIDPAAGAR